jgi:nucleoid-associated protein EbfC
MSEINFQGTDLNDIDVDREVQRVIDQAKQQQKQLEDVQKSLLATQITGSAERGLVTVTMSGGGRFTAVTIDRDAVRRFEPHLLGQLVLEAIHDAMGQLAKLTRERFGPLMSDPSALDEATTYWKPEDAQTNKRQRR